MAELTPKERLSPSLLDRLTDDFPFRKQESREFRIISMAHLREIVKRDLAFLFNCCNLGSMMDLDEYPEVKKSVLNYGLPDLAGVSTSNIDVVGLEKSIKQAILKFEPRLRKVKVSSTVREGLDGHNNLLFIIDAELWGAPAPIRLLLESELDLEGGNISVNEAGM